MNIQPASAADLPVIMALYDEGRAYMRAHGNLLQWADGYPSQALMAQDIRSGHCMLCVEDGEILGVFSCIPGPDPTYARIEGGQWLDSAPYGVIHRICVRAHRRGVASFCFQYGLERFGNLRIDTHADNFPMQNSLEKNGFTRCGVIYLENGDPRVAFQKHPL